MKIVRAFRHGEFQAIPIPAELAHGLTDLELEIERMGDELRIRPSRRSLNGVLARFAEFGKELTTADHRMHEQGDREDM